MTSRARGRRRAPGAASGRLTRAAALGAIAWIATHLALVRARPWSPGRGTRREHGRLSVRRLGGGDRRIVLLHGLLSSGDSFGAHFDDLASDAEVLIPDLLGFGESMWSGGPFDLGNHLEALDGMSDFADARPTTVVGHSMGAQLALMWAARQPSVDRVVALSAPLYTDRHTGEVAVRRLGPIGRLFALDRRAAAAMCAWMCRHRRAAKVLAAVLQPHLPSHLAARTMDHTWPAYEGALDHLVLSGRWSPALDELTARRVGVVCAYGARDRVVQRASYEHLPTTHPSVRIVAHTTAGHHLPLAQPAWTARLVRSVHEAPAEQHRSPS